MALTSAISSGDLQLSNPFQSLENASNRPQSKRTERDECYEELLSSLDKLLSLSCIEDGIDSLLGSVFFDPNVPCNLFGAQSLGIRKAVVRLEESPQKLARAIAMKNPRLSALWLAATWTGKEELREAVNCALDPLATINLPIAWWTGTLQSFLQVKYHESHRPDLIPRTLEFSTAYFARDVRAPFARAPPFGNTRISNTSLEVRHHLDHKHRPLQWQLHWILKSGERLLVDSGSFSEPCSETRLPKSSNDEEVELK